jgi:hypothetical protein
MPIATMENSNTLTAAQIQRVTSTTILENSALLTNQARREREPWDHIMDDLLGMRALQNDWDGMGAEAPSSQLVDSTLRFAQTLRRRGYPCPSRVGAGPNGTVLFEWQLVQMYLEAEITEPRLAEWMQIVPGQPPRHWEVSFE